MPNNANNGFNRITYILTMVCGCLLLATATNAQTAMQVMSFNIRYDNPKDSPNHWQARKEKVASQILFHDADMIGIQEALHRQVVDMKTMLPGYGFAGVGRDDGKEAGEFSGIFYNRQKLQMLESSTFWLSLSPSVPGSKSWDAAITRVVTWAKFKSKQDGKVFYHFNTHFDHMGQEARRQSAHLLLQKVNEIAGNTPAVITGDFNAQPTDEPIRILTDTANPLRVTDANGLSATGHYGPKGTFNGWGPKELNNAPIDYIFLKGPWTVQKHATLSQTWGGLFSSDHFPVLATLVLGPK